MGRMVSRRSSKPRPCVPGVRHQDGGSSAAPARALWSKRD